MGEAKIFHGSRVVGQTVLPPRAPCDDGPSKVVRMGIIEVGPTPPPNMIAVNTPDIKVAGVYRFRTFGVHEFSAWWAWQ